MRWPFGTLGCLLVTSGCDARENFRSGVLPRSVPHTVIMLALRVHIVGTAIYQAGSRLTKRSGVRTYVLIMRDICVCGLLHGLVRYLARERRTGEHRDESGRSGFAPVSAALAVSRLAGVGFRGASPRVPPYFAAAAAPSSIFGSLWGREVREGQRKRCGCSQAGDVIGAAVFCLGLSVLVLPKTLLRGASAKGLRT